MGVRVILNRSLRINVAYVNVYTACPGVMYQNNCIPSRMHFGGNLNFALWDKYFNDKMSAHLHLYMLRTDDSISTYIHTHAQLYVYTHARYMNVS